MGDHTDKQQQKKCVKGPHSTASTGKDIDVQNTQPGIHNVIMIQGFSALGMPGSN
jgi:hypothetical protein